MRADGARRDENNIIMVRPLTPTEHPRVRNASTPISYMYERERRVEVKKAFRVTRRHTYAANVNRLTSSDIMFRASFVLLKDHVELRFLYTFFHAF